MCSQLVREINVSEPACATDLNTRPKAAEERPECRYAQGRHLRTKGRPTAKRPLSVSRRTPAEQPEPGAGALRARALRGIGALGLTVAVLLVAGCNPSLSQNERVTAEFAHSKAFGGQLNAPTECDPETQSPNEPTRYTQYCTVKSQQGTVRWELVSNYYPHDGTTYAVVAAYGPIYGGECRFKETSDGQWVFDKSSLPSGCAR